MMIDEPRVSSISRASEVGFNYLNAAKPWGRIRAMLVLAPMC